MEFLPSLTTTQWVLAGLVPPALVALYFLKLRRQPLGIPSTLLWRQSLEDLRVNTFWQRLRRSILLLLQLLVVLLLLLSLSNPTIQSTQNRRNFVLLVDNSASMSATDDPEERGTRLDQAKAEASAFVSSLQPGDAVMVLTFSDRAEVIGSFTDNLDRVRNTIASIKPTARRTRPQDAFAIAASAAHSAALSPNQTANSNPGEAEQHTIHTAVHLFSDGDFDTRFVRELAAFDVTYHQMGSQQNNIGVIAFASRRRDDMPEVVELFARLISSEPAKAEIELHVDGKLHDLQRVEWTQPGEQSAFFTLKAPKEALLEIKLRPTAGRDYLAIDNQAWAVISERRPGKVLLFSDDDEQLKRALGTPAMNRLATVEALPTRDAEGIDMAGDPRFAPNDLIIFDRCRPKTMPETNTFSIGTLPPSLASALPPMQESPSILTWDRAHPALRFVDLANVYVLSSLPIEAPPGSQTLISSDRGPLLLDVRRGRFTDLVQTFPLINDQGTWQTDWPLRISFPLYLFNVIHYLAGHDTESENLRRAGDTVEYRAPADQSEVSLTLPDGQKQPVSVGRNQIANIRKTDQLGIYGVSAGKAPPFQFAVNLLDEEESSIRPAARLEFGERIIDATEEKSLQRRELWEPIVLAIILLILAEWYIFNQRVIL